MVAISIAVAHPHGVVVRVDLCGAQRVLRVGKRPRLIGGGGELGAAVVQDVVVAEGEHARLGGAPRLETTRPAI